MNIRKFSLPRQWIVVIDAFLVLTTGAMFVSQDIVFLFHLIFILLSVGAFFWNFRGFVIRVLFWVSVTTAMVLRAIQLGQTQYAEIIEIPMLSIILLTVFLIASRRASAQTELLIKNKELQHTLDERNALQEALARQAFYDPLTGLPNRVLFYDRLRQALARAARHQGVVAVLFMDFDGFKSINDRFGHDNGDKLLAHMAERMQSQMRSEDTVARLGGDEFTVLLANETSAGAAGLVARRLLDEISMPYMINDVAVTISASIGIAISTSDNLQPEDLVRNADHAMYHAKANGKAGIKIFNLEA
ncbi:MAG: GGDEF domain-containing protein [Chloroflexota bacterium]